ncbi:MAG: prepilin-type N-terminal cleavage/methylation domain-containing protein [Candidatus Gastranaerophilales bacterium]|nr:prepilin-type N-terminal cleavage/methylation domain-containing protein [Candidatus Gastranaerophilales bacterium]
MKKIRGFTLSEVLITLVIIGIIAAISIPALIQTTNNLEYITAYKKLYSELCNFHIRLKADNGGYFDNLFSDENTTYETFIKYFNKAYKCSKGVTDDYCFPEYKHGNNDASTYQAENTTSLVLNDGMILIFDCFSSDCTNKTELNESIGCVRIRADLNGLKKPNIVGRDIFDFYITEERIIVRGDPATRTYSEGKNYYWNKGYKILSEGTL